MNIKTTPVPFCDECGSPMALRQPMAWDKWKAFWGCSTFPECNYTLSIDEDTGEPYDPQDDQADEDFLTYDMLYGGDDT